MVMEAGAHGVPTVAYHAAGGVGESVVDGRTGLLVDDLDEFVAAVEMLLRCERLRTAMARGEPGARAAGTSGSTAWRASTRWCARCCRHRRAAAGDRRPSPRDGSALTVLDDLRGARRSAWFSNAARPTCRARSSGRSPRLPPRPARRPPGRR